jgi:hypothetical protein
MDRTALCIVMSGIAGGILLLFAGFADAACHCMTPMFVLFPYGATIFNLTDWQGAGLLMMLIQFPLYMAAILTSSSARLKIAALVLLVAIHSLSAFFGLRGYCNSRHTCWNGATQQIVRREPPKLGG